MKYNDNSFKINIKVFVHYPEVFNSTVINNRFEKYFNKYFDENKIKGFEGECYVIFKTTPINENQMIIVDLESNNEISKLINKDKFEKELKDFIFIYFDRQIKEVVINYLI